MKTVWQQDGEQREMAAPLSLIISAFAPVSDVRRTLTPQLRTDLGDTDLVLIDLGQGRNRLGGSALGQVYRQIGDGCPDVEEPAKLKALFDAVQDLSREGLISRLPRPLRRRPVHDPVRDGVRRPLRTGYRSGGPGAGRSGGAVQ